jgi:ribosomal protein S18 acetylase RimI-like enzyme
MKFKRLCQKDKPAVAHMYKKTFPEIPLEDLDISWEYRSQPDSYGIWDDGKLAGFVLASFHTRSGSSMYIDFFALDEAYRGNGIGTQLVQDFLCDLLKKNGSIHLFPRNEIVAKWYMRNGFRESTKGYYVCHSYQTRSKPKA